ncbi:MAG: hypothetical protein GFH24_608438n36 [Chloroflexi bacterium AL-N5]|nr:hypothetical protein [Chloroflexi bacterium AL-N5]
MRRWLWSDRASQESLSLTGEEMLQEFHTSFLWQKNPPTVYKGDSMNN